MTMSSKSIAIIALIFSHICSWSQVKNDSLTIMLREVVLKPETNWLNTLAQKSFENRQVISAQDVLQSIPGLWIGQHAGGGKAEQLFLRGFDLDHGTDIAINVDGVPVNMVSHAHGQGYADLHYVIPETLEKIDFDKGPYSVQHLNFATAGSVDFNTKSAFDRDLLKVESGSFNTQRLLSIKDFSDNSTNAWVAIEALLRDGPFESPQNFQRFNFMGSWERDLSNEMGSIKVTANHFTSSWFASGQIPTRAVEAGLITRFGAIDDQEGGSTSRSQINIKWKNPINEKAFWESQLYGARNYFSLFSNFTFFLDDPVNGDQIHQLENRFLWGFSQKLKTKDNVGKWKINREYGLQLRSDFIDDLLLAHTLNRTQILENIQLGTLYERQFGIYHQTGLTNELWDLNFGLRWDMFYHSYRDRNNTDQLKASDIAIVSPKLKIGYRLSEELVAFFKLGKGYHTNDTRAIVSNELSTLLPGAYGADFGFNGSCQKIDWQVAFWGLLMDQEFVYVGDAGIVEARGASSRKGIELSIRQEIFKTLNWSFSANTTKPRFIDAPLGENYIPLAPILTSVFNINWESQNGIFSQLEVRHISDRPATEDFSIVAEGYTIINSSLGINHSRLSYGLQIFNLLNAEWKETQFATQSRMFNEPESVEEIHFTPGSPIDIRLFLKIVL
jgi:outer membrane receptor protein involved in Fe transport